MNLPEKDLKLIKLMAYEAVERISSLDIGKVFLEVGKDKPTHIVLIMGKPMFEKICARVRGLRTVLT